MFSNTVVKTSCIFQDQTVSEKGSVGFCFCSALRCLPSWKTAGFTEQLPSGCAVRQELAERPTAPSREYGSANSPVMPCC